MKQMVEVKLMKCPNCGKQFDEGKALRPRGELFKTAELMRETYLCPFCECHVNKAL